jgi:hypothetical protein
MMNGYEMARIILSRKPAMTAAHVEAQAAARAARIRQTSPSSYAQAQIANTIRTLAHMRNAR